ncbi:SprT family zinc-dependent metalloprotease [Idiomarina sp. OXR-189]|uniref:M48 family metallopeptidase n=1 Tax=Idiomarina sp. OXR-189 TaxID=3100175 RepID=UPI002AC9DAF3|nr:SprT family zinc-dependent metalloprotease [Idiomarina sp. OXR-189]WPZ02537.1 SprT family zinc-dependent metalloprotease [Idiomarina sp. OXR-189]
MNVAIRFADEVAEKRQPHGDKLSFYYADELIEFDRVAAKSPERKIKIKVLPDCSVKVAAPEDSSDDEVLRATKKRARWIYQQLREFRKQLTHITPRRYVSGESHYYLGKQYVLKVLVKPDQAAGVKLLRGQLEVNVREYTTERIKVALEGWYKVRAKDVFHKRLDAVLEQALWVDKRPPLRILTMQTQWGSCSPNGRITLNPLLVKAPRECLDYVILHELCHIAEHNHSERFYRLMGQVMPNWERVKDRLDQMAGRIFNG